MRLSTPLFSVPSVNPSVQKPAIPVASQREGGGGGVKRSQLRGLERSISGLSQLSLVGEYVIGTLTNGQTIKVPKNFSRTEIESEFRRLVKLRLHHNEVPTQGPARP